MCVCPKPQKECLQKQDPESDSSYGIKLQGKMLAGSDLLSSLSSLVIVCYASNSDLPVLVVVLSLFCSFLFLG